MGVTTPVQPKECLLKFEGEQAEDANAFLDHMKVWGARIGK